MSRRHELLTHIVESIAEVDGCTPQELEYSLYNYVETEALLELATSDHTDWQLTFCVPDHTVEVRGNGQVLVDGTVLRELDRPSKKVE